MDQTVYVVLGYPEDYDLGTVIAGIFTDETEAQRACAENSTKAEKDRKALADWTRQWLDYEFQGGRRSESRFKTYEEESAAMKVFICKHGPKPEAKFNCFGVEAVPLNQWVAK